MPLIHVPDLFPNHDQGEGLGRIDKVLMMENGWFYVIVEWMIESGCWKVENNEEVRVDDCERCVGIKEGTNPGNNVKLFGLLSMGWLICCHVYLLNSWQTLSTNWTVTSVCTLESVDEAARKSMANTFKFVLNFVWCNSNSSNMVTVSLSPNQFIIIIIIIMTLMFIQKYFLILNTFWFWFDLWLFMEKNKRWWKVDDEDWVLSDVWTSGEGQLRAKTIRDWESMKPKLREESQVKLCRDLERD